YFGHKQSVSIVRSAVKEFATKENPVQDSPHQNTAYGLNVKTCLHQYPHDLPAESGNLSRLTLVLMHSQLRQRQSLQHHKDFDLNYLNVDDPSILSNVLFDFNADRKYTWISIVRQ